MFFYGNSRTKLIDVLTYMACRINWNALKAVSMFTSMLTRVPAWRSAIGPTYGNRDASPEQGIVPLICFHHASTGMGRR